MTRWPPLPADVAPVPGRYTGDETMTNDEIEALVAVERIECVSHDTGFEEPADPLWRICVDGYCADFEYELAAQNVAAAINKAHATALTALQAQLAAAEARAGISEPYEPGGFVGDIYYGHPVKTTFGTHRWNGAEWGKLPSEAEVLTELLAEARKQRDAAEALLGAAYRAGLEDAADLVVQKYIALGGYGLRDAIRALPVPADLAARLAKEAGE